jgi:hypothetical protein
MNHRTRTTASFVVTENNWRNKSAPSWDSWLRVIGQESKPPCMAITSYGLQYKVPLLVDLDRTKYILWTYRFLGCMTKTNNSKPLFSNIPSQSQPLTRLRLCLNSFILDVASGLVKPSAS